MKPIPDNIQKPYTDFLKKQKIALNEIPFYLKWLRYYLDFCEKYSHSKSSKGSLSHFKNKLEQKNQSLQKIEQAQNAISLFYNLIASYKNTPKKYPNNLKISENKTSYAPKKKSPVSRNESWKNEFELLTNEIKLRHYSQKTFRTYRSWVKHFQSFIKSKSPQLIDSDDAKRFITYLAVEKKVAASTQNQAFNALLFFYRHILKKEFGDFKGIPRAKRTKYAPAILSRTEIDDIINNLKYPYTLVVKLLYGCGLRLKEGLNIRVRDIDFNEDIITVYGKGRKVRKVLLPKKIIHC